MAETYALRWTADLEALQSCTDQNGLTSRYVRCLQKRGFRQFSHIMISCKPDASAHIRVFSGPETEFALRYKERNFFKTDPVVNRARQANAPFFYDYLKPCASDAGDLVAQADRAGFAHGIAVPLRVQGGLTGLQLIVPETAWILENLTHADQSQLIGLSLAFHTILLQMTKSAAEKAELTRREIQCLNWASTGKTCWETSRILKISERTVQFHLDNARTKLGTGNLVHSVAKAVKLGLISE